MALISSASADSHSYEHSSRFVEPFLHWLFPQMPEAQVKVIHHLIRKGAYLAEYAVLALLLWRTVRRFPIRRVFAGISTSAGPDQPLLGSFRLRTASPRQVGTARAGGINGDGRRPPQQ